jgi:6-phosphogluconate dehydrogenase (decarboxylating)
MVPAGERPGRHVRRLGELLESGDVVVEVATRLTDDQILAAEVAARDIGYVDGGVRWIWGWPTATR